jgi:hypothetical protein
MAIAQYIIFHKDSKQLILTTKAVGLLCQQAQSKIDNISDLEPHSEVGLIATISQSIQLETATLPNTCCC